MRVLLFLDVLRTKRTRHRTPKAYRDSVRIRRSKIDKLACQAQSERIFAEGEITETWRINIALRPKVCYNKTRKAVEI
jgi:hypothetical protein